MSISQGEKEKKKQPSGFLVIKSDHAGQHRTFFLVTQGSCHE